MGRLGTPEDVAALVSFLVRDEASFVTGKFRLLHFPFSQRKLTAVNRTKCGSNALRCASKQL